MGLTLGKLTQEQGPRGLGSVRFAVVLGALQLDLQAFHADLKAVHGLDSSLCGHGVVVAHEAWKTPWGGGGGQVGQKGALRTRQAVSLLHGQHMPVPGRAATVP